MNLRMLEEYKFLRKELEINRKFVFERPLLIVGATITIAAALKGPLSGLSWSFPILLTALIFNLWFTYNRLWSSSRIVAYIQLVHEGAPKLQWIGWENALHEFRRIAYRMDQQGKISSNSKRKPETYHSMGYYGPIFYFHLVLCVTITMLAFFPTKMLFAMDLKGVGAIEPINLYAALISLTIFIFAFIRFRPGKVRYGIEQNREVWINALGYTRIPALLIELSAVKNDPALHPGTRGERKIVVTHIDLANEEATTNIQWESPRVGEKAKVEVMPDMEVAFFTHIASQDRHYHQVAKEIYMVVEGTMVIEVEGKNYTLSTGDMIIVNPNSVHQVKIEGTEFICLVVSTNCGGDSDKYIV